MRTRTRRPDSTFIGMIVLFFVAVLAVCLLFLGTRSIYRATHPRPDPVVGKEVKARMQFHGVQVAYEGHDGKLFFYRNGRKCRL